MLRRLGIQIKELGKDLGEFFMDSIDIDIRPFSSRTSAETTFALAMNEAFPEFDFSTRKISAAFATITDLMAANRGKTLTNDQLLNILSESLGLTIIPDHRLHIHVRSDQYSMDNMAIEIDASTFSGSGGIFPVPERWHSDLAKPIDATARWAREHSYQRIEVSGSYRISTAFALGWSFRSVKGFEIDIKAHNGDWKTDDRSLSDVSLDPLEISVPLNLINNRLIVTVGIIRDPRSDVQNTLGIPGDAILSLFYRRPITSSAEAQSIIQDIKLAVSRTVSSLNASMIDLYIAGPALISLALGHRWNGLPATQVYEFLPRERRYTPTFLIE
jgi:hypothetical protein